MVFGAKSSYGAYCEDMEYDELDTAREGTELYCDMEGTGTWTWVVGGGASWRCIAPKCDAGDAIGVGGGPSAKKSSGAGALRAGALRAVSGASSYASSSSSSTARPT